MAINFVINWIGFVFPAFFVLAVFFATFLFWRAGRREFIESDFLMDVLIIFSIGAFLGGRFFDFFLGFSENHLSILRLLFFNRYGGFDFYGALVGALAFTLYYLRNKRFNFLQVFDLFAAPIIFFRIITTLGHFLSSFLKAGFSYLTLYYGVRFFLFLLIFWFIKRLEAKKRHKGFFAGFYLVSTGLVDLVMFTVFPINRMMFGRYPYQLIASAAIFIVGSVFWYRISKRNAKADIKNLFGVFLLFIFGTKRVFTNISEADRLARSIIILPYTLAKTVFAFVKLVVREIVQTLAGFAKAMGKGK